MGLAQISLLFPKITQDPGFGVVPSKGSGGADAAIFDRSAATTAGTYTVPYARINGSARLAVIGPVAAAVVPEPASWAMMVGGLGLIGATLRRRKVAVSLS